MRGARHEISVGDQQTCSYIQEKRQISSRNVVLGPALIGYGGAAVRCRR